MIDGLISLARLSLLVIAVLAIGAAAVYFLGLAWGLWAVVVVGYLMTKLDMGQNGEGAFVVVGGWILLVIGLFIGLLLRLVLQ